MNKTLYEDIYSEPVREILGRTPHKIVIWGTGIFAVVFLMLIFFSWLIKYPDRIKAPVEITTINPPVSLQSKITGRINELHVKDKDHVTQGQLLAVMETAAAPVEINRLAEYLGSITNTLEIQVSGLPQFSKLGEIQEFWGSFRKCLSDYDNYKTNDYYGNKIRSVNEEISALLQYIGRLKDKEKLCAENLELEARKFGRDSLLHLNGVFTQSDLEKSRQGLIRLEIELEQARIDQSAKAVELAEKRQLLSEYRIKRLEESEKYLSILNESYLNLKAQLQIWQNTYLLLAPFSGTATFTKFWSENQTVSMGETVMNIVPASPGDYVGRISLTMNRSGKVSPGQLVNVKLSGYPYLEFGMLKGQVKSKSLVPSGDTYIIEIELPEGLKTMYGNKLEFHQNMQGTAEIITEDIRLLVKILSPLRHLITRNMG